jgi:hypothetical protein
MNSPSQDSRLRSKKDREDCEIRAEVKVGPGESGPTILSSVTSFFEIRSAVNEMR